MILACNNISKAFGTEVVLSNISFHINEHEKMAIVGNNGAGKSTLLKIIMNELSADTGEVIVSKGATVGYLSQHQELSNSRTIYEELLEEKKDVIELEEKARELEVKMKHASDEELDSLLEQYNLATHLFTQKNGYAYQSEITGVLKGLGFSEEEFSRKINSLSGGQKTRVALGRLLLSKPDLILLDEPTNHLDMESIRWLETYLLNYNGAVIIVSHDRYFLDRIVSKVVELEHNKAQMFTGNYTAYAEKKAQLREALLKQYYNQQQTIRHQQEVITKLRSFNREKSIKRAESREKLLNKMEVIEKPITEEATMHFELEPSVQSGNDVLTVKGLSKAFGDNQLFSNLDFEIKREEKVAILGNNGTGKTTILKIINGLLPADSGEITIGSRVAIGYYDQEHQVLDMDKTLFDELSDAYPEMDNTQIRNVLAAFLFTGDDVYKRIKDLSGGERGRVSLAKLMLSEANLLILDEPTNHLDIASKEILENAISHYRGTVLYVSHDRYFVNKTATRILDLTGKTLLNYIGNYDYYLEKKEDMEHAHLAAAETAEVKTETSESKLDWQQQKDEKARLRKLENDIKKCENRIHELETRDSEIDELLSKEEVYTNVAKLMELNKEKKEIEEELELKMEEWEELLSQS